LVQIINYNRHDIETNIATECELTDVGRYQEDNLNSSGKYNVTTKESAAVASWQLKARNNLQNPTKNLKQSLRRKRN
jgi:hypothetical protein